MFQMRDPAEVEAEERAKTEAKKKKELQKENHFKQCTELYGNFFEFKHIMWLSQKFFACAFQERVITEPVQKASNVLASEGYPSLDIFISTDGAFDVVREWLEFRFGGEGRGTESKAVQPEQAALAAKASNIDLDTKEQWSLADICAMSYHFQNNYLEADPTAGFANKDVEGFRDLFDKHRGSLEELQPQRLWGMLADIDMNFPTAEDQKYVLSVLSQVDSDRNGTLCLEELLHLVRKLIDGQKVEPRVREYELLQRSGMELSECEEWFEVFGAVSEEVGWISMLDIKAVFEKINVKWDKQGTIQMKEWLTEVDDDYNGQIDFGEFCCLVQKMWDANFGGIRAVKPEAEEQ